MTFVEFVYQSLFSHNNQTVFDETNGIETIKFIVTVKYFPMSNYCITTHMVFILLHFNTSS